MNSTELFELTLALKIVLWVEAIVYLGLGIFEIFDDFFRKLPSWTNLNGKLNAYLFMEDKMQHKFHAIVCFFLGFIALNGILEGAVTRFEIELLFIGLALVMMLLWMILPPGKMAIAMLLTKPETYLSVIMFLLFSNLIRIEIFAVCILFNIWGMAVFIFNTRKLMNPYTYKRFRDDVIEAGIPEYRIQAWDKMTGYKEK
tara:strand:+ start:100 stop:699 length:600 start_codon:yes stop_codon:yes gene_type:complete